MKKKKKILKLLQNILYMFDISRETCERNGVETTEDSDTIFWSKMKYT